MLNSSGCTGTAAKAVVWDSQVTKKGQDWGCGKVSGLGVAGVFRAPWPRMVYHEEARVTATLWATDDAGVGQSVPLTQK